MEIKSRRRGRLLLALSAALLGVFGVLLAVQMRHQRFTPDADLMKELAAAAVVEEDPITTKDWPQWRGPRRDGIASGAGLIAIWPAKGPPLQWHKEIGDGYASFAVANGKLYTLVREGASEVVLCWDLETGEEIWRHTYDCTYSDSQGSGPRSTPTLADGKLYTVGATGVIHCLGAASGKVLWQHDLLKEFNARNIQWGASLSPLVDSGLVFANPGGPGGGSLAAFRKDTGDLVWKVGDDPAGYSSPLAETIGGVRQVIYFTGTHLRGVTAATGKLLWEFRWQTDHNVNAATPIHFRAVKGDQLLDYVFISSSYGKGCALVKIEGNSSGAFQARSVYQGTQMKNHFSTCVRSGMNVYGFDDASLVCMNLQTGATLWKQSGFQKGSLLLTRDFDSPAPKPDRLIILGETGRLALAEATPEQYVELAKFQALGRRCWTMPVLADGRLIVRDEEQVKCFDLRDK